MPGWARRVGVQADLREEVSAPPPSGDDDNRRAGPAVRAAVHAADTGPIDRPSASLTHLVVMTVPIVVQVVTLKTTSGVYMMWSGW